MRRSITLLLPLALVLAAIAASLAFVYATAPDACLEVDGAFGEGMQTDESGDFLGFYSHCAATDLSTGAVDEVTLVNWAGTAAVVLLSASALGVGLLLARRLSRAPAG